MIELENLQEHLKSLKADDWERLFSLLPEIEATKKFGEVVGFPFLVQFKSRKLLFNS